jgi:hypothetical protein
MCTGEAVERLLVALQDMVIALEVGDWPTVVDGSSSRPAGRAVSGPGFIVRQHAALRCIARSMEHQFHGDVHSASEQLDAAVRLLPGAYAHPADRTCVVLPPRPTGTAELTTWLIGRLVRREKAEIEHLRDLFAPDILRARDQLVESCVQHLTRVDLDPFAPIQCRKPAPYPDQSRASLCGRASALRRLANPLAVDVSKSVWLDAGGFPGLRIRALDRLAERPDPAPWCGTRGTEDPPVRCGLSRAWEHARGCRRDADYWK